MAEPHVADRRSAPSAAAPARGGGTIAFVTVMHGVPWGGSEELWSEAASRLSEGGWDVRASVIRWGGLRPQVARLAARGCRVSQRPHPESLRQRITRRLVGERHRSWLRAAAPRLVVINQGSNYDGLEVMGACRALGLRYVTIAHAANDVFWPDAAWAACARDLYASASAAFFVSRGNLELTQMQIASRLENAEVVANPFNVKYDARPPWPGGEEAELKLACVGRLHCSSKGQDLLLNVLRADKWRGRQVEVTLYGDGTNRGSLEALADLWGLASVRFGGFREDVEGIWADHHALVMPSRYEGLPLAVVEAMLCRRACIVTPAAGGGELVRDGVEGFVADAPAPACLDAALERAWAGRTRLERMGWAAGEAVRAIVPEQPVGAFVSRLEQVCAAR